LKQEKIEIIKNDSTKPIRNRILVATPTLGIVRVEWAQARFGQTTPCNWTAAGLTLGLIHCFPMGYLVADAQNIAVDEAVTKDFQWLLLLEDDVVPPADMFLRLNEYMKKEEIPVVSGLYYLKGNYPEPLVYRGRGNSCYDKFKLGDLVWTDGVPTGCLLIHTSILKLMWKESPEYQTGLNRIVHKVFETPAKVWKDPETGNFASNCGTSDLYWCDRVMKEKVLERSGWKKIGKQKFPFLIDTGILCKHIDLSTGKQYPLKEVK